MFKRIIVFAVVFILRIGFAWAGPIIEFDGRYWMPDFDSDIRVEESNIGTDFDVKDDLGFDDENFPDARVIWNTGPNSKFRIGYTQISYEGSQAISRTIEFGGKSYTGGTLVNSEMDISYMRLGWIWQFINIADKFKAGPVLEAKGIMADVKLEAPNLSPAVSEKEEFIGGLPTAGVALDFTPIDQLNLFCEAGALYAGEYGHFLDAEAGIEIKPLKNVSLIGGYRIVDLKVEYEPDYVKMRLIGPFAGGKIMF